MGEGSTCNMVKYLFIISALFTACSTSNTTHAPVVIYDTVHKPWCCKYDTTKVKITDTARVTWCCLIDTVHAKDTVYEHVNFVLFDTSYAHIQINDTTFNHKDSTVINYIKKTITDTTYLTVIKNVYKDSTVYNYFFKDTSVYRFIPLYTNSILRKYLNDGNQTQVTFTIQYYK